MYNINIKQNIEQNINKDTSIDSIKSHKILKRQSDNW